MRLTAHDLGRKGENLKPATFSGLGFRAMYPKKMVLGIWAAGIIVYTGFGWVYDD